MKCTHNFADVQCTLSLNLSQSTVIRVRVLQACNTCCHVLNRFVQHADSELGMSQ